MRILAENTEEGNRKASSDPKKPTVEGKNARSALLCYQHYHNHFTVQISWIFFLNIYCIDKPETNEELKDILPVETESHPAEPSSEDLSENAVSVLKFEIIEVQYSNSSELICLVIY